MPETSEYRFVMQTGGGLWDLGCWDAQALTIRDLARSLAAIVRYAGHTIRPYTVAEHSVLVAEIAAQCPAVAADPHLRFLARLMALVHDAPEALTSDIPSPVKRWIEHAAGAPVVQTLERTIARSMARTFGWPEEEQVPAEVAAAVAAADRAALVIERRALIGPELVPWGVTWPEWAGQPGHWRLEDPADPAGQWLRSYTTAMDVVYSPVDASGIRVLR